jgi:hypothetical protein
MKIFAAIPTYDGKILAGTVKSLLDEQTVCAAVGDTLETHFLPGCSLITMARNQLAQDFMDSDADRFVFIDADLEWEPGSVAKLARMPVEFVGAAYRLKQDTEAYSVGWCTETAELWSNELGLIKVSSLPTGFMSLSRDVFGKLRDAFPAEKYTHMDTHAHAWFQAPFLNGQLYGEDAYFCHKWQSIGGEIWLDPSLTLTHVGGSSKFKGCIGDWLKARTTDGVS